MHDWPLRVLSRRSGVSVGYLSEIERGVKQASNANLMAILRALDVTLPEYLRLLADLLEDPDAWTPSASPVRRYVLAGVGASRRIVTVPEPSRRSSCPEA